MDLLEHEKPTENKSKKIIKTLLIISIIAVILIIALMIFLSVTPEKQNARQGKVFVDDKEVSVPVEQIILKDAQNNIFFSIKELSKIAGYNYFNGKYLEYTEDKDKCYIEMITQIEVENEENKKETKDVSYIVGLESNSNMIYKTYTGANTDYEYIQIDNMVVQYEENLYIAMEDVRCSIRYICKLF